MARLFKRLLWLASGVLLAVVALEVVLRFLPVSMGTHRSLAFDRWPLEYTVPRSEYHYSIGWAMRNAHSGTTNNYGHVAPFDFEPRSRPVLVIGDSYIESLMNDYADSLQGQLGRMLGTPRAVYGLGVSGASASGYIGLARLARDEFEPRAAVILISDGDLSESLLRTVGSHHLRPLPDGTLDLVYEPLPGVPLSTRIRNRVGDFSLHRYLQINLQFAPGNLWQDLGVAHDAVPPPPRPDSAEKIERQKRVADWFLEQLPASVGVPSRCIALLVDVDRYAIYDPKLAQAPKDNAAARAHLIDAARQRGFAVSDLGPVFRARYEREHLKFDHHPIDRHWNGLGHGVAAEEVLRLLGTGEERGCLSTPRAAP